jgi:nitrous oxidase accessory protein
VALLAAAAAASRDHAAQAKEASAPVLAAGRAAPPRPASCAPLAPGASLQRAVDAAPEGGALCLAPGTYAGPLRITRPVTLWGEASSVVRSPGAGTTVQISGKGARVEGLTVSGSGRRYDNMDAGIAVDHGEDVSIEGVRVEGATYGVVVSESKRVAVRGCVVVGADRATPLGLRGDGIRLWEAHDARVEDNRVTDSRDVVVWYSTRAVVARNVVERGRYGAHLMYGNDAKVHDNVFRENEVGVFVMYSRNVELARNTMRDALGPAGMGVGVKESGNVRMEGNAVLRNTSGLYLDASPLHPDDENLFRRNRLRGNGTAVAFHASLRRNTFRDNDFAENETHVRVDGGGDAADVKWEHNAWDDYAGYDLDGDGTGDVPYAPRSLSGALTDRHPNLLFFRGSPTLALIELAGRVVPLFAPRTLLVDPRPAMELDTEEACHAN